MRKTLILPVILFSFLSLHCASTEQPIDGVVGKWKYVGYIHGFSGRYIPNDSINMIADITANTYNIYKNDSLYESGTYSNTTEQRCYFTCNFGVGKGDLVYFEVTNDTLYNSQDGNDMSSIVFKRK